MPIDPTKQLRASTGGCAIHCHDCSMESLCIPFSLNNNELDRLDEIIERKKPVQKGDQIFKSGDPLKSLFAIRSGTIKSYTITEQGDEQITGFHLAGDVIGFDGIHSQIHQSFAQALETAMVCEIPFDTLDTLAGSMPKLRQQIMRLMSNEIMSDQEMILLLSKKNAEERLAAFISNLANRFGSRGFSPHEFRLTMTRGDIGNYLGLTVETISRLLGRFQKSGFIEVKGKYITIVDHKALSQLAGNSRIAT
ncbi:MULTISPECIES: electron transport transcriptional regulator EtrA [unclassified Shewanella]|uniref:electron transport transcriptional regulator EtrA n=1 Tax=unclassified Shewanella TaxID=196818 RepID=UPI000C85BA6D|nr:MULTISPECIES: electron transport transcriptional regulator EtrA [unclassified Shewanella]MDO6618291.1 electron transport transcriptional regulator EtrA [Shewanella sp. 6_MG-2023]MDO6641597.1 electron transport transcriptional regulator EtrA [Shewanella sp. 5_MG-2023]MDO6679939.1 electron transport transcriptional regulator EtrA [Shewanella sp. 4_MG-2023]MDO6775699.1 electron transport transcriptional regulator EtrA [Shewanella sp. 3_MG-2023]PMG28437.1 transcriptional regulator [Shewanella s